MSQFTIEQENSRVYLVYRIDAGRKDRQIQGMITQNSIPGLIQAIYAGTPAGEFMKYDISGKVPLQRVLQGTVSAKQILSIFRGITEAILTAEDYMIQASSLVFNPAGIYTRFDGTGAYMVCLPVVFAKKAPAEISAFFLNLLSRAHFADEEGNAAANRLAAYLNTVPVFSAPDFLQVIAMLENQGEPEVQAAPVYQEPEPQPVYPEPSVSPQPVYTEPAVNPQPVYEQPVYEPQPAYQEAPQYQPEMAPVYASPAPQQAYFHRLRTRELAPIHNVLRIGKERSSADFFIGNNAAISRRHAVIEQRGTSYYITDLNSTNHTFINGQPIPVNMPVEIRPGMTIQLADEQFELIFQ